jgi:DNA-binding NtrC family response regulator
MKEQHVLLFDLAHQNHLSTGLLSVLEPHFSVHMTAHDETSMNGKLRSLLQSGGGSERPDLVFLIISASQLQDSKDLMEALRSFRIPVVVATDSCDPERLFQLLNWGGEDFIIPPFDSVNVLPRAWRLMQPDRTQPEPNDDSESTAGLKQLIGRSPVFLSQVENLPLIARSEANVLIVGETGTGKELYARAIHYRSERAGRPFMPVNCGAIPIELVENELFGHERGAFTSASNLQTGLIAEANGGTLFLDEIDCLPLMGQVKLLRFLQEKEYRPLGSSKMRQADVRIIAASNLDFPEAVRSGRVRQDLFYRLNVISVSLPPLRERCEDIPHLARHFLDKYAREFSRDRVELSPDALNALLTYNWPGNVRELEHIIERAMVMSEGSIIQARDLVVSLSEPFSGGESLRQAKAKEIARFEKNYIQGLLRAYRGNITKAAQVAQKNRRAFWQLIQKHEINVSRFKSSTS